MPGRPTTEPWGAGANPDVWPRLRRRLRSAQCISALLHCDAEVLDGGAAPSDFQRMIKTSSDSGGPIPAPSALPAATDERSVKQAVLRGARQTCPACGKGGLFYAFLKVAAACPVCGEALHHQRADDAPAYFTMVVVAHVVVGGLLAVEQAYAPATWVQLAIWLPATVIMSLLLLPRIKGMLIGLQWALRMHGFGGKADEAIPEPLPNSSASYPAARGRDA